MSARSGAGDRYSLVTQSDTGYVADRIDNQVVFMKRRYAQQSLLAILLLLSTLGFATEVVDYSETISVYKNSPEANHYFDNAYGYALFPTVGKAGLGIGAAHGKGQVYRAGKVTGTATLTQLSVGFQAGGQAFSQIIFFQDQRAYEEFTQGNFEFDATASAVAVTAGLQAQAGTTGKTAGASSGPRSGIQAPTRYSRGMATFIHAKGGLMYQAAIGGQKFKYTPL
jgi:hypothetical protein